MASISGRLADMAGKEGRREVQRNELARQVGSMGVKRLRKDTSGRLNLLM